MKDYYFPVMVFYPIENSSEEFKCKLHVTCILQKQPNIITQINDRQMAHLASGGEFNVTMDTEGLVWVWGKNDFGQVNTKDLYLYDKLVISSKSHTLNHFKNDAGFK